jgi:hypothetical protein
MLVSRIDDTVFISSFYSHFLVHILDETSPLIDKECPICFEEFKPGKYNEYIESSMRKSCD